MNLCISILSMRKDSGSIHKLPNVTLRRVELRLEGSLLPHTPAYVWVHCLWISFTLHKFHYIFKLGWLIHCLILNTDTYNPGYVNPNQLFASSFNLSPKPPAMALSLFRDKCNSEEICVSSYFIWSRIPSHKF